MMKKSLLSLCLVLFVALNQINAQCPGCIPDQSCGASLPDGGICNPTVPPATIGEWYETDVTFYMPVNITDPGTGFDVELQQLTIVGINGLPFGIDWECDAATSGCTYLPPSNPPDSYYGCVRFCGVPLGATGIYPVVVDIVAEAYVPSFGITVTQSANYNTQVELLPGTGGNAGFTFSPTTGCDELEVEFEGIIDASPQVTEYSWQFGNGDSATGQIPDEQYYDSAGTYLVTLQTDIRHYVLTDVCANSLNDNWCGDVEEWDWPFTGCTTFPDPYFKLFDADGNEVYVSNSIADVLSGCWNDIGLLMLNPPYTIELWDHDPTSADDNLGQFAFNMDAPGTQSFSGAGGTSGTLTFSTILDTSYIVTDTLVIGSTPLASISNISTSDTIICANEDITLTATPGVFYQWFKDSTQITGAITQTYTAEEAGLYSVVVADVMGCAAESDALSLQIEAMPPTPIFAFNGLNNNLTVTNGTGYDIQWYLNGLPLPGANDSVLTLLASGDYEVELITDLGCSTTSAPFSIVINSIDGSMQPSFSLTGIYPNPAELSIFIDLELPYAMDMKVSLLDNLGRVLETNQLIKTAGSITHELDISAYQSGLYFVRLETPEKNIIEKVIKK